MMSETSKKRLPLLRLVLYLIVFGVCGPVASREIFYALAGDAATGTVLVVGRNTGGVSKRSTSFWAEYEYFDAQGARHVGKAQSLTLLPNGVIDPATSRGDQLEVQFLRDAPETSRLAPSSVAGVCFGAVALLAGVVFVGELATQWRRRRPGK